MSESPLSLKGWLEASLSLPNSGLEVIVAKTEFGTCVMSLTSTKCSTNLLRGKFLRRFSKGLGRCAQNRRVPWTSDQGKGLFKHEYEFRDGEGRNGISNQRYLRVQIFSWPGKLRRFIFGSFD
ncbi:hypothetical protein SDJN03_19564, partial [Cucurbita argyrosperma subsp. sororia]